MTKAILGALAGLIFGTAGALAYSHYVSDQKLADLQAQLDAANDKLATAAQDKQSLSKETSSVSDQIDQLQATNDDLKKQLEAVKSGAPAPAATAAPELNPMLLMGMMRGMGRGGMQGPQRMVLLQTRLHLTPDQAAKIKAAMDADGKARRDLMQQMFRNGGKIDPQAAAMANSLDMTLAQVLTPGQQVAYKQVQADEQASRADTMATMQVDQMMPLLQLTDAQKDQVYNSIYQAQLTSPDPTSLMGNPNAASILTAQAKAVQDAMTKVLTPDQVAIYQQAAQAMPQFGQGGRRGQNGGGQGNGGQGAGGGQASNAPAPAPAAAVAATTATPTSTDSANQAPATNAAPADPASTNAAPADAASTNAAPATAATTTP